MPAKKSITLIILQADRKVWNGAAVTLKVTALRQGLKVLYNKSHGPNISTINIELDLLFDAGQVYGISVDTEGHRSAWQLINHETFVRQEGATKIEVNARILQLMLIPENPVSSNLDEGWTKLRNSGSPMTADNGGFTETAFKALQTPSKMALLNIDAKLRDTRVNIGSLLSFVEALRHVAPARLFLFMRADLKTIIAESPEFGGSPGHKAPSGTPIPLPAHPDSWKHRKFAGGNLQLSFAKSAEDLSGKQVYSVDADIDLGRGLDHVAEWLDNEILHPSKKTDQTLVYALLHSQGIIPNYTLDAA